MYGRVSVKFSYVFGFLQYKDRFDDRKNISHGKKAFNTFALGLKHEILSV